MKKYFAGIVILFVLVFGCKPQQIPGGPYDTPPTATPQYYFKLTILHTQTPLANADITIICPDKTKTITGKTDSKGNFSGTTSAKGLHYAKVSHSEVCKEPNIFNLNINQKYVNETFSIDAGTLTFNAVNPNAISITTEGGEFSYIFSNIGTAGKKYQIHVTYFGPISQVLDLITYSPKDYIEAKGDSIVVKYTFPKLWQFYDDEGGSSLVTLPIGFYITNEDGVEWLIADQKIYQTWKFNPGRGTVAFSGGTRQIIISNININPVNMPVTNICIRVLSYQYYVNGQWIDHSCQGGLPVYLLNGSIPLSVDEKYCFSTAGTYSLSLRYTAQTSYTTPTGARLLLRYETGSGDKFYEIEYTKYP